MDRREALVSLATTTAIAGATSGLALWRWDNGGTGAASVVSLPHVRDYRAPNVGAFPDMAISRQSKEPGVLVERAIAALGGMSRFISRGDVVAIKPNIGWDRTLYRAPIPIPRWSKRWCGSD